MDSKNVGVVCSHPRTSLPGVSMPAHLEEVGALCSWRLLGWVQMLKSWKGPERPQGEFRGGP